MNLHVRHASPDDAAAVARIFSGPKAVWGTCQIPFPTAELWRKNLTEPEPGLVSLVACHEAEVVGILGLHTHPDRPRRRHAAEVGNKPAIRLYERFGFAIEGTLRQYAFRDGRFVDALAMARLRGDTAVAQSA